MYACIELRQEGEEEAGRPFFDVCLFDVMVLFHLVAATKMNNDSSRSHAVFTIIVEHSEQDGESKSGEGS